METFSVSYASCIGGCALVMTGVHFVFESITSGELSILSRKVKEVSGRKLPI